MTSFSNKTKNQTGVFVLGVSGPSFAGKSTLAHLLSSVIRPHAQYSVHGDDFCRDISVLPIFHGHRDADGPDGVDSRSMTKALDHLKANEGKLPDDSKSWQADVFPEQQRKALEMVSEDFLKQLRLKVADRLVKVLFRIVILEGFLLYHQADVHNRLDGRLFIRLDYEEARRRRIERPGYERQAKEGEFWKTEDCFDKMVWRNYREQHADLFENMDIEGSVDKDVCNDRKIVVQDVTNLDVEDTLCWATEATIEMLDDFES